MEDLRNAPYSNGTDRISRLPDNLINCILEFLDTKYAVQTCVLSKRWVDIWKSLPSLYFNRNSFSNDKTDSFIMFVDMVFLFRKDIDIQKFSVRWINSESDNSMALHVNRWSLAAVKHNVKDISIQMSPLQNFAYEIPHRLLNCKSLRKLELYAYGYDRHAQIILPRSMNLPQLKVLTFIGLSISDVESSNRLFSSCPVLEALWISDCDIRTGNQRNMIVDSLSLKGFKYVDFFPRYHLPQNNTMTNTVKLCAPKLEVFTFNSLFTHDYSLENCSPLSRVSFYMTLEAKIEDENAETYLNLPSKEKDVYAKRVMKYLGAVYMVKRMRLSSGFLQVLSQAPDILDNQPPCLSNLEFLAVEMWFTRGCLRAIAFLLNISPRISRLLLVSKESNIADDGNDWDAGLSLPGMLPHLKFVQIEKVEGCDAELKLLSFLLKNAKVLEEVALFFRSSVGSSDRVTQVKRFRDKLRTLPTASSNIKMMLF